MESCGQRLYSLRIPPLSKHGVCAVGLTDSHRIELFCAEGADIPRSEPRFQ